MASKRISTQVEHHQRSSKWLGLGGLDGIIAVIVLIGVAATVRTGGSTWTVVRDLGAIGGAVALTVTFCVFLLLKEPSGWRMFWTACIVIPIVSTGVVALIAAPGALPSAARDVLAYGF